MNAKEIYRRAFFAGLRGDEKPPSSSETGSLDPNEISTHLQASLEMHVQAFEEIGRIFKFFNEYLTIIVNLQERIEVLEFICEVEPTEKSQETKDELSAVKREMAKILEFKRPDPGEDQPE